MSKALDPEIKALRTIIRALTPLPQDARRRIVDYVLDRVRRGDLQPASRLPPASLAPLWPGRPAPKGRPS